MTKTVRKIIESILDDETLRSNGILYETDFKRHYFARMGKRLAVPNRFIGTFSREESRNIESRLTKAPRGTWAIIDLSYDDTPCFKTLMSDGKGKLGGGQYNTYDTPPSFESTVTCMVGYEAYCLRKEVERDREVAANKAAMEKYSIGQIFRNIRFAGEKAFSTIKIAAIQEGEIIFEATRRGSPARRMFSSPAAIFDARVTV